MFLVGGGIITHGVPGLNDWVHRQAERFHSVPGAGVLLATLADVVVALLTGGLVVLLLHAVKRVRRPALT